MVFQINKNTIKSIYKKTHMKKIIKLDESDLLKIINKVLSEQGLGRPIPSNFGQDIISRTQNTQSTKNIATIQTKLKSLGYNLGTSGPNRDGIDGVYGKMTRDAIIDFQRKNNLTPDGIVGTNTAKKLGVSPLSNDQIRMLQKGQTIKTSGVGQKTQTAQKKQIENLTGQISERSYKFIERMKLNNEFKGDTFMIVNKDASIISLFGPNYKFLGKDTITTGRSKDPGVGEGKGGYEEWYKRSLEFAKKNPNNPESKKIKKYLDRYPNATNLTISPTDKEFPQGFPYSYTVQRELGLDFTPSGAYRVSTGTQTKGFEGYGKGIDNTFKLRGATDILTDPTAVHGSAGENRKKLRQHAGKDGQPIKNYTRAGAGCINVGENFLRLINQYEPEWVFILPDNGKDDEVKITTFEKWTSGLISLGEKCVRSIYDLFS